MSVACPILRGPLAGLSWRLGRGKVLRVLLGTYEPAQTERFVDLVRPGAQVLDVGAHVGYYTLLSARLAGSSGRVAAFEPSPANLAALKANVAGNRLANVTIVEAAVAGAVGTACFDLAHGSGTGHLTAAAGLEVPTVALDGWCAAHEFAPDVIKMDIEGAEAEALPAAVETLRRCRPVLLLSTHGLDVEASCRAFLGDLGYDFESLYGADGDPAREFLCRPQ
jgi:FkbM family methyltransferase